MVSRHRRSTDSSQEQAGSEPSSEAEIMSMEEFWNAMADAVEAMSNEELRAELAPLKAVLARNLH